MPIKKIVIEMPDGTRKTVSVEMPDEAPAELSADQKIRAARPAGFDDLSPLEASYQGLREGMQEGAKGFAKEIVPAVGKGIANIPQGIFDVIKMAASAAGESGEFFSDPAGTLSRWAESAKGLPAKAKQALDDTIALAANDPQAFGSAVADVTGDVGVGVAAAKALPMAVKPVAEKTGKLMQTVGTKGEWPIRMVGAHQLGSGNPLGAVIMGAPEGLVAAGKKLEKYGRGGISSLDLPEQRFAQDIERSLSKKLDASPAREGLEDLDAAIAAEKKRAGAIRVAAAKSETAAKKTEDAADLAKTRADETATKAAAKKTEKETADEAARLKIEEKKKGLVAREPRITETVKAPGQSMSTTFGPSQAEKLTPLEQELLKRATSVTPVGRGAKVTVTPAPSRAAAVVDDLDEIDLTGDITPEAVAPDLRSRAAERFGRNYIDEGATTPEGRGLPQDLLDEAVEEAAPPALDIPPSTSRRSVSAVDDRMSENDFDVLREILRENPDTPGVDAISRLLEERAARARMYRNRAGLDAGADLAFDLDE